MTTRAVLDHVVHIQPEERVGAQRLVDVVQERHVHRVVQTTRLEAMGEQLLRLRHAGFGQRDGLVLLVLDVVAGLLELFAILRLDVPLRHGARRESRDDAIDLVVEIRGFFRGTGNDQRRPRFVDQDAVDFVDDRVVVTALHVVREVELHVVAEVVEAELVVGAVGDVGGVGDLAFLVVQLVLDHADRHAQKAVEPSHPLGVAAREVVVDGDDVNAFAGQGVQVCRQRRDERLAFAGLHLRDPAAMQDDRRRSAARRSAAC